MLNVKNIKNNLFVSVIFVLLMVTMVNFSSIAQQKLEITNGPISDWDYISSGEEWEPLTTITHIGVLRGSFYEMGFQYGERAAYGTAQNSDVEWGKSLESCDNSVEEVKLD